MSTISIRQLLANGTAKRADALKFRHADIHVEPGFNLRTQGEDLQASIEALAAHIADGGLIPPLEVRPRAEGGVWLVDGHRRHAAVALLLERGVPLADPRTGEVWMQAVMFEGNDVDRVLRVLTSAEGRSLSALEQAEGYRRLGAYGWSIDQIASKAHKSATHVRNMLKLINANSDVQALVNENKVSATEAAKVVKQLGEQAGEHLNAALAQAQAAGKSRVTARSLKPAPRTDRPTDAEITHAVAKQFCCDSTTATAWLQTFGQH